MRSALVLLWAGLASAHSLWLEAEEFAPLEGTNFSFQHVEDTTRGSWSLAGPGVAAEWTQGGESGWLSIAARADEPGEVVVAREVEVPAAGHYALWVRYADYRGKKESFGVRIRQGKTNFTHRFGEAPVVDELDPMKLLWDWSFGWDRAEVDLGRGRARVEIFTTGKTEARRHVDCLCLTTDGTYHPGGRERPDHETWKLMRTLRPAEAGNVDRAMPAVAGDKPTFLWNISDAWLDSGIEQPFTIDPPLANDFLARFRGKELPVFGDASSSPTLHISVMPKLFARFSEWLARHPERKLAVLLNYGEPRWTGTEQATTWDALVKLGDRFVGFIAGENLDYAHVDAAALETRVKAARSRADVLGALRELHTAAVTKKFSAYAGRALRPEEAWARVVPCLSMVSEAFAHAAAAWGVRRVGHESTAAHPVLARRLAFLRGAARQFAAHLADYQSANFGDAATMFDRQAFFYPASSRYILDNQYDAWAGAGLDWLLKDYLLFWLAGADTFYHEEGNDIFWKPGGNVAGDAFPVELSPRGRLTAAMQALFAAHARGTPYTPVAFLLDEAHGWSDVVTQPGAFGLDPALNPKVLARNRSDAAIRGWLDVAWFPAPETQNEPATAVRQSYVNGIFGDIFDVLVTAPGKTATLASYPLVILAGELHLTAEWERALRDYVKNGGTLIMAAGQAPLATFGAESAEADAFVWAGETVASNRFRRRALSGGRVLATAPDGAPLAVERGEGRGRIVVIGVPLGLGIDEQPVPLLPLLLRQFVAGLLPVEVHGDVEWLVNRLDDGGWLVALLNNRGVDKPQHGVVPTDHRQAQAVQITVPFGVARSEEWLAGAPLAWQGRSLSLTVPAGVARLVAIHPAK